MSTYIRLVRTRKASSGFINRKSCQSLDNIICNPGLYGGEAFMKIAQISPLYESVPPKYYGGTERVVSYLTEELVHQGHQVTLFASGDSVTKVRLVTPCPYALRLDDECRDQLAHAIVLLDQVFRQAPAFDLIHFHIDYLHFPLSARQRVTHVTTLHRRLDIPD